MNEAAEDPIGPVCISNIHAEDVPATVRGTWLESLSQHTIPGIWYCEECAQTGEMLRLFTRDEDEAEL